MTPNQSFDPETLVADYTRSRLARKAITEIHLLIRDMEQEQQIKKRIAVAGITGLLLMLGTWLFIHPLHSDEMIKTPTSQNTFSYASHTHHVTAV